jgi:hypothetical protein
MTHCGRPDDAGMAFMDSTWVLVLRAVRRDACIARNVGIAWMAGLLLGREDLWIPKLVNSRGRHWYSNAD